MESSVEIKISHPIYSLETWSVFMMAQNILLKETLRNGLTEIKRLIIV